MATRSLIGKANENGSITYIYCHFDGYPSHNGFILKNYYDTEEKVDRLLELGNLSSLGETLEACVAYSRDRGETGQEAEVVRNLETYLEDYNDGIDFFYVFQQGEWVCYNSDKKIVQIP